MNYRYKATKLITEEMDAQHLRYRVYSKDRIEEIDCSFPIDEGPIAHLLMLSRDDDMDVSCRVFGLLNDIPKEKQDRILRVCNKLNNRFRFAKFVLNEGDLNVEYDFPVAMSEESVGKAACEIFRRFTAILDGSWPIIMKALFASEESFDDDDDVGENRILGAAVDALKRAGVELSGYESPQDLLDKLKTLRSIPVDEDDDDIAIDDGDLDKDDDE